MPIIRNPFARRPGAVAQAQDDNTAGARPGSVHSREEEAGAHPGFEKVDTVGSKASSAWSIRSGSRKSQDTGEYKMSVVNDSGIYLPPSPIEKQAIWPRRYLSRNSDRSEKKSSIASGEIDAFPISRESFDSYRRSFDISAKRPVIVTSDTCHTTRQSLDSSRFFAAASSKREHHQYTPRFSRAGKPAPAPLLPEDTTTTTEESSSAQTYFEDVGLNDEENNHSAAAPAPVQKKKTGGGFFSRLSGQQHHNEVETMEKSGSGDGGSSWGFGMVVGRKQHQHQQQQQQQAQIQELGVITRPMTSEGGGHGGGIMRGVEVEA
ncbi:hypothetical protein QBC43DRAFT_5086 [Cladorrhinum sp. PSN259]|nr:hypothetical protein QBC43DRAFT_5086 [Cladorrhinum sp. PSN259]